jgi:hypothetical protein
MFTGETAFVLDNSPDLLVRQQAAEWEHAGPRRAVLDDPEDFTFRAVAPEPMVVEIARGRFEVGRRHAVTLPAGSMTIHTRPLALVQGFPSCESFRRRRQRILQRTGGRQLISRHARHHDGALGSEGCRRDQQPQYSQAARRPQLHVVPSD